MNEIKEFKNQSFGELRAVVVDNEPWFVAKDVTDILGYSNARDALARHVDEEDKNTVVFHDGTPGNPNQTIINESGLYSLIMSSKLPAAKQFKRWVTSEVLPSIRKNGAYIAGQTEMTTEELLASAHEAALKILAEREKRLAKVENQLIELEFENLGLQEDNKQQARRIEEMEPKATYFDAVLQCKDAISTRSLAEDYGWTAQSMNKWLKDHDYQYKESGRWYLYSKYKDKGYTVPQTFHYTDYYGNEHANTQTYWTQSGRLFIYEQLKKHGVLPVIERMNSDIEDEEEYF